MNIATTFTLSLAFVAGGLSAQGIPDRPEMLSFEPLVFHAPVAKDYRAKLKNGITVFLAPDEGSAFVNLGLTVRYGAHMDPAGKEGLSSLVASQWRAGGTRKTSAEALDEQADFLAARIGAGSLRCLTKDLNEVMRFSIEVLLEPTFAQEQLDLAKRNLKQNLERRNDQAGSIQGYTMGYLLNGENHFSSQHVTSDSLEAITREDLLAFHRKVLHPANMILTVSGRFERKAMLAKLERTYGALKPGAEAQVSPKAPASNHEREPGIYVVDKDVPQAVVGLVMPGLRRTDPHWFPAMVMNEILGGSGFTARLMKKVRSDEGLTYGVGSQFGPGRPYGTWRGDWSCGLQTKNRSVAYALRLILGEIERMRREPVNQEELDVIKGSLIQGFPSQFSSRGAIVNVFAQEENAGWPEDFYATYREKIQAVTPADIQNVAQKYLDASRAIILVTGKAAEIHAGDPAHPGVFKTLLPLPFRQLPLRDPLTMKPLE